MRVWVRLRRRCALALPLGVCVLLEVSEDLVTLAPSSIWLFKHTHTRCPKAYAKNAHFYAFLGLRFLAHLGFATCHPCHLHTFAPDARGPSRVKGYEAQTQNKAACSSGCELWHNAWRYAGFNYCKRLFYLHSNHL